MKGFAKIVPVVLSVVVDGTESEPFAPRVALNELVVIEVTAASSVSGRQKINVSVAKPAATFDLR